MRAKRKLILVVFVAAIGAAALVAASGCRENKIHDDGNYATATTTVTPPKQ